MPKDVEQIRQEYQDVINKSLRVIDGLQGSDAFRIAVEDFKANVQRIDSCWHLITDPKQLEEFRITKLAANSIIFLLDNYRADLEKATIGLAKLDNPDMIIDKDWDTEGVDKDAKGD